MIRYVLHAAITIKGFYKMSNILYLDIL